MLRFKFFLSVALLFVTIAVSAEDVTPQQAEAKAQNFFAKHGMAVSASSRPKRVKLAKGAQTEQTAPLYIFNSADRKAFAVVAGDDRAPEILAYGLDGAIDEDSIAPAAAMFLDSYREQIDALRSGAEPASRNYTNAETNDQVLLQTANWNQSNGFWNKYCPQLETRQAPAGCGPTAMAILMRYYEWPRHGWGSHKYTTNSGITLEANFSETDYNLDLLPLGGVDDNGWTSERQDEVARLLLHCGIALNTEYRDSGSTGGNAFCGMFNYFGYTLGARVEKEYMSEDEWKAMLCREIDSNNPVYYLAGLRDTSWYHAFVCDGYDAEQKFHLNFGWGGSSNGFYVLDDIAEGWKYRYLNSAYIGVRPDYERDGVPPMRLYLNYNRDYETGFVLNRTKVHPDMIFNATLKGLFNIKPTLFSGTVALFLCDEQGNRKCKLGALAFPIDNLKFGASYITNLVYHCYLPSTQEICESDRIYPFSTEDGGNTWTLVGCCEEDKGYIRIANVYDPTPMPLMMTEVNDTIVPGLFLEEGVQIKVGEKFKVHAQNLQCLYYQPYFSDIALYVCSADGTMKKRIGGISKIELKTGVYFKDYPISCTIPSSLTLSCGDYIALFTLPEGASEWFRVPCVIPENDHIIISEIATDIDAVKASEKNAMTIISLSGVTQPKGQLPMGVYIVKQGNKIVKNVVGR